MDVSGCVVVGVDGSDEGRAVGWAADEASRRRVPLVIAFAEDQPARSVLSARTLRDANEEVRSFGKRVLAEALAEAIEDFPALQVRTHLDQQAPAAMLIAMSGSAQMIVVGSHGRGRVAKAMLGSVSERVTARAACPVAVVGPLQSQTGTALVVAGIGPRGEAESVLRYACEEARLSGAGVLAVHAWTPTDLFAAVALGYFGSVLDELERAARSGLQELVATVARDYPAVPISSRLVRADLSDAIARATKHASAIVIGRARPEDGPHLSRAASAALRHAACPVIVVSGSSARTAAADLPDMRAGAVTSGAGTAGSAGA